MRRSPSAHVVLAAVALLLFFLSSNLRSLGAALVPTAGAASSFSCTPTGSVDVPPSSSSATSASVELSADERTALINLSFASLRSEQDTMSIYRPAGAGEKSALLASLPLGQFDAIVWEIAPTADLSVSDQIAALKAGLLFIDVHSANKPDGEDCSQLHYASTVVSRSRVYLPLIARPSGSGTEGAKLRWAPPALTNPTTIALKDGYSKLSLDPTKDYIITLPPYVKRGGISVVGGHHVVIIGGHVQLPAEQRADDGTLIRCDAQKNCDDGGCSTRAKPPTSWDYHQYCRAFYVAQSTGTVHVEGVVIDGRRTKQDAFAINAPEATVQIQNVRVEGLYGDEATWHADVIQPWGGVKELRVDRLTAETAFQGLQIAPDPRGNPNIGTLILSRTNISGSGNWKMMASYGCSFARRLVFEQLYVQPGPGRTLANTVWPPVSDERKCNGVLRNGKEVVWPDATMQGVVILGPPPGGDFVLQGTAGNAYQSPGYQE